MINTPRENNFDFLRLLFSSLVIISHSFPLTGNQDNEPLLKLTNNQIDLGGLSVKCFFIISGFLIYQSLQRSTNFIDYIWKRILRLFPALIVMGFLMMTIIGLMLCLENKPILENYSFVTYYPKMLSLYFLKNKISGVFENLPNTTINGSLWTLCYEFSMYMIICVLFFVKNKIWRLWLLLFIFCIIISHVFIQPNVLAIKTFRYLRLTPQIFYELGTFFLAGSLLTYINFDTKKNQKLFFYLSLIIIFFSVVYNFFYIAKYIFLPYIVISFGKESFSYINKIGTSIGDTSYGIYIYGWFIQQLLLENFNLGTFPLMVFSLIISFILGLLSWHFIEKKSLRYKNLFSK